MIGKPRNSIRRKLTTIIMLTTMMAVALACLGLVAKDVIDVRRDMDQDLLALGEMISMNSTAPLTFGDRKEAGAVLALLQSKPSVVSGAVYTDHDLPFATYIPGKRVALPAHPRSAEGIVRSNGLVELFRPIMLDGKRVGTVYIASDLRDVRARMKEDAQFVVILLGACLVLAFLLSSRLQRRISAPIVELARVAGAVSQDKDYTIRAAGRGAHADDEIGELVTGFNAMLAEIEQRDHSLMRYQMQLEETVAVRTEELTQANRSLLTAKNAAERIAEVNAQLARESALILNSATDGIMGVGPDFEPSFLNPAAARMLGRELGDFAGHSPHELIHHSRADGTPLPEAECPMSESLRRGEALTMCDDTFWRADGSSFPIEYSATPTRDEAGNMIGAVVMFRDVTERRAIERLKSEFVSTVSHELRTPLTSIRGALGLLGSGLLGPIPDKAQRMLEIAVSNTDRLVRLINDILDLERIESGRVELTRAAVDAESVMVQAAEGLQTMADQAQVRLVVVRTAGSLWGDGDRIIQTLTNLLGNAIKFSPPDTTVTLTGAAGPADYEFCITDEGRGVPEDKLQTIFDRFSQVDASDSRDKGGSGLGLAICQSIVNAHGGRIWAERNEPAGSSFHFTIPLVAGVAVAVPIAAFPSSHTILLCPSDATSRIAAMLGARGFRVVSASTAADVIARAGSERPDAIVLAVTTPDDGWLIVEALKGAAETCQIPIVVAMSDHPGSYESYAATVANWIRKPLRSDDLIQALDLACRTPSVLVVEDDLDLARVMTTALESRGIRTLHAVNGGDAVQLCKQHEPSLIVLDVGLPDMDGFAVVGTLRESAALSRIPLLVYSALDVGSADQSRLRLGPTEFLTKSRTSLADFESHVVRLLETVTNQSNRNLHAA